MPAAACASLARYRTVRWTISLTAPRICASALGRQSEVLMVCLLADWLDLGLARMAEPCTASPGQIAFTAAWPHQTYAPGAAPLGQSATAQAPGRAVRQRHGGVLRAVFPRRWYNQSDVTSVRHHTNDARFGSYVGVMHVARASARRASPT
jgi:hypothetical protein